MKKEGIKATSSAQTKLIRKVLILLFIINSGLSYSQHGQEDLLGSWLVVAVTNKISNRLRIPTLGILRHYKSFSNYEFVFFRTGLTYYVHKNFLITGGLAYLDSKAYINDEFIGTTQQFWVYEELSLLSKLGKMSVSNRIRLETRWIDKVEATIVNNRIRYRIQDKFPLNDTYYLKAFNEYFFNIKAPHFNQNRFFYGLGYRFSKNIEGEMGYLKNHFKAASYDRIRLAIHFKTDFINTKKH